MGDAVNGARGRPLMYPGEHSGQPRAWPVAARHRQLVSRVYSELQRGVIHTISLTDFFRR